MPNFYLNLQCWTCSPSTKQVPCCILTPWGCLKYNQSLLSLCTFKIWKLKGKCKVCPWAIWPPIPARAYPSFLSMKQHGVSLPPLPMLVHHKVSLLPFLPQSFITQFVCTHGYSLVERGRVKVLPKNPTHLHGQEKLKGYKIFCIADYWHLWQKVGSGSDFFSCFEEKVTVSLTK